MSRPLRIQFPGAVYHLTARGNVRAAIFLDEYDRGLFLSCEKQDLTLGLVTDVTF